MGIKVRKVGRGRMEKDGGYVMVGKKKGGRYVKGEEMTMEQFGVFLSGVIRYIPAINYGLWSRITGRAKEQEGYRVAYIQGYKDAKKDVVMAIGAVIDLDRKGERAGKAGKDGKVEE